MVDEILVDYRYVVNKITKTLFLLNYAFYIWDVFLSNYKTIVLLTDYQRTEVQPVCGLVVVWYPDVRDAGRPKPLQWLWWRWPVLVYLQPTATLPTLHHHGSQAHTHAGSSTLPQPSYQVWVSPTSQMLATNLVTFKSIPQYRNQYSNIDFKSQFSIPIPNTKNCWNRHRESTHLKGQLILSSCRLSSVFIVKTNMYI